MPISVIRDAVKITADISSLKDQREARATAQLAALTTLYLEVQQNLDVLGVLRLDESIPDHAFSNSGIALGCDAHRAALVANLGALRTEQPPENDERLGLQLSALWGGSSGFEEFEPEEIAAVPGDPRPPRQAIRFVCVKIESLKRLGALESLPSQIRRDVRYRTRLLNVKAAELEIMKHLGALEDLEFLRRQ